jgi:hypothetical protein
MPDGLWTCEVGWLVVCDVSQMRVSKDSELLEELQDNRECQGLNLKPDWLEDSHCR